MVTAAGQLDRTWTYGATSRWVPSTDSDKALICEQVERILQDPFFNRSRRYPSLLRFLVSQTLDGHADSLKERVLGVEVFDRKPDYDSTQDPIVRVTVAEIRKRILRYYQEPAHQDELHIWLPVGSYGVQFELPRSGAAQKEPANLPPGPEVIVPAAPAATALPTSNAQPLRRRAILFFFRWRRPLWILASAVLVILACFSIILFTRQQSAFDAFWGPLFQARSSVLVSLGDQPANAITLLNAASPGLPADRAAKATFESGEPSFMRSNNVTAVVNLTRMLIDHGRTYILKPQSATSLSDLSSGPSVLICAFNNYWTLKMTDPLRYHFANDPSFNVFWIEDRKAPTQRRWLVDARKEQLSGKDYAIVAKFTPPETRQPTVVIAGLSHSANIEAVKFVLSAQRMSELDQFAPQDWRKRNIEFILQTEVINGNAGPASIVAVYTW